MRSGSQVVREFMREFVDRQQKARDYSASIDVETVHEY